MACAVLEVYVRARGEKERDKKALCRCGACVVSFFRASADMYKRERERERDGLKSFGESFW